MGTDTNWRSAEEQARQDKANKWIHDAITAGGGGRSGGSSSSTTDISTSYINDMYAAQAEANRRALEAAYEANINSINAAAAKIPQQYQSARNSVASQSEVQKANFNEYAAANGLNSGAGGQATLAMGNQLQSNLSGLSQAEASAQADLELQRTQLTTAYQNDIAKAIADGNFQKAQALYDDYQRRSAEAIEQKRFDLSYADQLDSTKYNRALENGNMTGNYSGMSAFGWSPEDIASANKVWQKQMYPEKTAVQPSLYQASAPAYQNDIYKSPSWANSVDSKMIDPALGQALGNKEGIRNAVETMATSGKSYEHIQAYMDDLLRGGYITSPDYRAVLSALS